MQGGASLSLPWLQPPGNWGNCHTDYMRFDTLTAIDYANRGRLEEWVHGYLLGGPWRNEGLSDGLKLQQRWWRGPLELPLSMLARCVGTEPGMEYPVINEYWEWRMAEMVKSIRETGAGPLDMPPLIASYDLQSPARLSVRDGNDRLGAYERLGWHDAWVLIWYNSEADFSADAWLMRDNRQVRG